MLPRFIDSLEDRRMLSLPAGPVELTVPAQSPDAVVASLNAGTAARVKKMPRVGDRFVGTTTFYEDGHRVTAQVNLKFTRLVKQGQYVAVATSSDDPGARFTYQVKIYQKTGVLKFSFKGEDYYGKDNGTGSGKISADGRVITGKSFSSKDDEVATFKVVKR